MRSLMLLMAMIAASLVVTPTAAEAQHPLGAYRGGWSSATTGHHGPMRVRLRETHHGEYRAVFAGRFAGVIPFVYGATLTPTGHPGHYVSAKRLPLMGTYEMSAVITPYHFNAQYTSRRDFGQFNMTRVHP